MSITIDKETAVVVEESGGDNESTNEVVAVIIHLDSHHREIGSKLLTNFYRTSKCKKLNSNIIIQDNIAISNEIIYHTKHNSKSTPPQLLYRGTRDGFKAKDFHSRCDNQGPTLTIIKSSEPYNQIFGGFTTASWKSSQFGEFISDSSAFIFKIDENNQFRKFNIKQYHEAYAIHDYIDYLPRFGDGCDIAVFSDCNLKCNTFYKSYSNFGCSYELPNNEYENNIEKARSYLAGSHEFKVSEIEVFKVTVLLEMKIQ